MLKTSRTSSRNWRKHLPKGVWLSRVPCGTLLRKRRRRDPRVGRIRKKTANETRSRTWSLNRMRITIWTFRFRWKSRIRTPWRPRLVLRSQTRWRLRTPRGTKRCRLVMRRSDLFMKRSGLLMKQRGLFMRRSDLVMRRQRGLVLRWSGLFMKQSDLVMRQRGRAVLRWVDRSQGMMISAELEGLESEDSEEEETKETVGYPGKVGCERTCEGEGVSKDECDAVFSCRFETAGKKCRSAVGPEPCPLTEQDMFELWDASETGKRESARARA
mmetsp:Transcript_14233/g.47202  ORF Transcript_14233/g.47202 Transcript_14233/m.47202 type:complete len:271 (-) Transcript_14233:77-889(-)